MLGLQRAIGNGATTALLQAGHAGQGTPFPPDLARVFGQRLGFDFGAVRVHADAAAAGRARTLGALAYTEGQDITFAAGQYQPHSARGFALLAHELTHVAQQGSGSAAAAEVQEQQADMAERGGSLSFTARSAPRTSIQCRRGDPLSLTVTLHADGTATFRVELEGGGVATASGSARNLSPGDYNVSSSGAQLTIYSLAGPPVPGETRFDIPWSPDNDALLSALGRLSRSRIPLHVEAARGARDAPSPGGGSRQQTSADADREAVRALPERIRNFLFGGATSSRTMSPEDNAALLRIAQRVADLSDEELAEYRARTSGSTDDIAAFEARVNAWLRQLEVRRSAETEHQNATMALYGLDSIYEMYRSWQTRLSGPPGFIHEWEGRPVSQLPETHEGSMVQLYLRMRRALAPHGYPNLAAFTAAIQRYVRAFRESAFHFGNELLDRCEHVLVEQGARYQDSAETTSLHASLAPARATFEAADRFRAAAEGRGGVAPQDYHDFYAAGPQYRRMLDEGRAQVAAQSAAHPLLANRGFPLEPLGRASQTELPRILRSYIAAGTEAVTRTRDRLGDDHEIIFRIPLLVSQTKARQGVDEGSIWAKIIADHDAPTVDDAFVDVAVALLAVGLGLLSGGSALAAAASLGLSSVLAIQQYEDYAFRSDAYAAQLLREEPSILWVVVALVGVGVEFAAVGRIIRPIRGALQRFQQGGNLAELELELASVEERIRRGIMQGAELELRARQSWRSIVPQGALRASLFGLDLAAEAAARFGYAVYLNIRRGINSFNRWVLTREAVDLIGDISRLSPEELQRVRVLYQQAVADTNRLVRHGRSLHMTPDEIDAALQAWARRGAGTVDDVMRDMTRREVVVDRLTTSGPVTRSSLPPGHVGGVRIQGPNGTYIQFLPLDEAGRARGVVARLDADMLARATGAPASGDIPGRAAFQDRGHLLARILGGPDIPQNLAPLMRGINQRDMRMAEIAIRNAIRDGQEATVTVGLIYREGRAGLDPEAFLVSVRWRDGREQVFRFANP
ncbi:DUF4157 domain-containing protein [Sorangium sp. So ce216]